MWITELDYLIMLIVYVSEMFVNVDYEQTIEIAMVITELDY